MSRLDSFIRRLEAQRACLDLAAELIEQVPGVIFELGLGNGRTYDHLRRLLPDREIYVFDRQIAAHPDCVPDADHLFVGDFRDSLPEAKTRFAGRVSLIHADIGAGNLNANAAMARGIAAHLPELLCARGLIVSDQELPLADAMPLSPPNRIDRGRYFLYRFR